MRPWMEFQTTFVIDACREQARQQNWTTGIAHRISIVVSRFSPRSGFAPIICDLRNSNTAIAWLDGPSHNSAVRGVTRKSPAFGSSGPSHHILSVGRQIEAATSRSRIVSAEAVMNQIGVFSLIDENEANFVVRPDFVRFGTAQISHEPY